MTDVTEIMSRIESGDRAASDELLPLVYQELRRLAEAKLAHEKPGQTLQATALVHEAYMRLVGGESLQQWDSSRHFFSAAAESMRRILVERARQKKSLKRGGNCRRGRLSEADIGVEPPSIEMIALDHALNKFEAQDPVKAELVKLRYFAGLTIPQAAAALGIAPSTADKYWAYAKSWLKLEIDGND